MSGKKVSFIATKYKNRTVKVNFYTNKGKKVSFQAVKRKPVREKVEFITHTRKG